MTFLIGYFVGVVCYVAYSAAIVSALAIAIIPIKGFDDLRTFKYIFTVHRSSNTSAFFLQEIIKNYKLNQAVVKVTSKDEIPHLLKDTPRYAFLSSEDNFFITATAENNSREFMCSNIDQVPVGSVPLKTGMFLRKGSDMTEIFNYKIIKLKELGLNLRYMQDYNKLTGLTCDSSNKLHQAGLGIPDIFTAFLIIIIGSGISFGVIAVEIVYFRTHYEQKYACS